MSEKIVAYVKHKQWKESELKHVKDSRATVGTLKEALKDLDDNLPIGVNFDGGYGYCDINYIILENGLYRLVGD